MGVGASAAGHAARAVLRLAGARVDGGAPRGVGRGRRASAEVGEDLVDHRRLGDERDDAHHAVAGRTRERVDLNELLQEGRRRAFAHRRLASVGASLSAGAIAGGVSAGAGSACRRMPRGRLAYQPEYRVVPWPWYSVEHVSSIRSSSCRLPLFVAP